MKSLDANAERRGRQRRALLLFAVLLAVLIGVPVHAATFQPPTGFNGHDWGQPFGTFSGLNFWRADTAMDRNGKVRDSVLPSLADPGEHDLQRADGVGTFVLAEYYFDSEPNPWPRTGIDVYTLSYLFCASGTLDDWPHPVKKYLKLCGARVIFHSATLADLAKLPDDPETNYDRVIRQLIAEYGEPPGYQRRASVTVETNTETLSSATPARAEFVVYRWCGVPPASDELRPTCPATVTFAFNATRGVGTVLYATGPMYDYAHARHQGGDENNELYLLLNARRLDAPNPAIHHICTATWICNPTFAPISAKRLQEFQP